MGEKEKIVDWFDEAWSISMKDPEFNLMVRKIKGEKRSE